MPATAEVELPVGGMTCAACARAVESQLAGTKGVAKASVNFASRTAFVEYDALIASVPNLIAAVEDIGYEVPAGPIEIAERAEARDLRRRLIIAAVFGVPVLLLGMWERYPLFQMILTIPVVAIAGRPFYRDAWTALRHRSVNMNSLIALGTGAAFIYSTWSLATSRGDVYFEASAVIIGLVLLGRLLESRMRGKASDAIRGLMNLQPPIARVIRAGEKSEKPVSDVVVGDRVVVRPGERIPVDGVVIEGASEIDESMLTGESMPVSKTAGSKVFAGTANGTGSLRFDATSVGRATALGRIVEIVKRAQGSKAPVARLADAVSGWFTIGVLVIATVAFFVWLSIGGIENALTHAVAVLIIACPCAMGLATPAALMAGIGNGARRGILFRSGESLENAARIDTVVFDKTGTLTTGRPRVVTVAVATGFSETRVVEVARAVEQWSEHPIARAIVAYALDRPRTSTDFRAQPGVGAEATVDGQRVFVGRGDGGAISVVVDGQLAGEIVIADSIRPESPDAVRRLNSMGLQLWLLTGDNKAAALVVADSTGIDRSRTIAGILPEGKQSELARLRAQGHRVAMVGDGINDAPGLAAANVGIAIGTGTDIAIETAGVVLMNGDPCGVPEALFLARRTFRVIRQNLFWAFGYNIVCIPLAAAWHISPMLASAAMALSSVSVVANSLRLRR